MKCELCNKSFNDYKGLSGHIAKTHKIKIKTYYDSYLKKENDGICYCGQLTRFKNIRGYVTYCSVQCSNKCSDVQEKKKNTCFKNNGVFYPCQSNKILEKSKTTCKINSGFEWPGQSPKTKEKVIQTNRKRRNCDNVMQDPILRKSASKNMIQYRKEHHCNIGARPNKGKYEKTIFDELQIISPYILLEDQQFLNYSPDRYVKELNIIIELYEPFHKYLKTKEYDIKRQKELEDHLKCKFFIIWLEDWLKNKDKIKNQFQLIL